MRIVVSLSGSFRSTPELSERIAAANLRIAADGGLDHLYELGLQADEWVGDMDSVSAPVRAWLKEGKGAHRVYRCQPVKDYTDGELALRLAVDRQPRELLIIGAFSPVRPDHQLANLLMAARLARRGKVQMELTDGVTTCYLLSGPTERSWPAAPARGCLISLLPLTADLLGVSYRGLRYPLEDATVAFGSAVAISNELLPDAEYFSVSIDSGLGALFVTPQDDHSSAPVSIN
jgi:thiamine pyrophosphokinase